MLPKSCIMRSVPLLYLGISCQVERESTCVLVGFLLHAPKQPEGKRADFNLHLRSMKGRHTGMQERNPETWTEAWPMEKSQPNGSLPCLAQLAFLFTPGPPAQVWHHPQWAGPSLIECWSGKYSYACLYANLKEAFTKCLAASPARCFNFYKLLFSGSLGLFDLTFLKGKW